MTQLVALIHQLNFTGLQSTCITISFKFSSNSASHSDLFSSYVQSIHLMTLWFGPWISSNEFHVNLSTTATTITTYRVIGNSTTYQLC